MIQSPKLTILNIKNVCRLCGSKMDLVSIFDKKFDFPQTMQKIVETLTTIEIKKEDVISQKICSKCVASAIKLFQFRDQSIRNNQFLKKQFDDLFDTNEEFRKAVNKLKESEPKPKVKSEPSSVEVQTKIEDPPKSTILKQDPPKLKPSAIQPITVHPSVKKLFRLYSQIRVPSITLKLDIDPRVVMELDCVENYFKVKKLNMDRYVQTALKKPQRVAIKSTSAIQKKDLKSKIREGGRVIRKSTTPKFSEGLKTRGKKRRRSCSSSSECSSSKIPLLAESTPSPVPSNFSDDFSDVCNIATKSHELHVCKICNSIHYHAKALLKHQVKHLRCQFCKAKFKTLKIKEEHVEKYCDSQKALIGMTNLPNVSITRLELDLEIRRNHSEALAIFPPIPLLEAVKDEPVVQDEPAFKDEPASKVEPVVKVEPIVKIEPEEAEIIEIESDEEVIQNKPIKPEINVADGLLNNILHENPNFNDVKLLKNLLTSYKKFNKKVTNSVQTNLPTNNLIKINQADLSVEMKSLKDHLHFYKVPINIKYGSGFYISYKYNSEEPADKELKYWDNLIPADIKTDFVDQTEIKIEEIMIEEIYNSQPLSESRRESFDYQPSSVVDLESANENELSSKINRLENRKENFSNDISIHEDNASSFHDGPLESGNEEDILIDDGLENEDILIDDDLENANEEDILIDDDLENANKEDFLIDDDLQNANEEDILIDDDLENANEEDILIDDNLKTKNYLKSLPKKKYNEGENMDVTDLEITSKVDENEENCNDDNMDDVDLENASKENEKKGNGCNVMDSENTFQEKGIILDDNLENSNKKDELKIFPIENCIYGYLENDINKDDLDHIDLRNASKNRNEQNDCNHDDLKNDHLDDVDLQYASKENESTDLEKTSKEKGNEDDDDVILESASKENDSKRNNLENVSKENVNKRDDNDLESVDKGDSFKKDESDNASKEKYNEEDNINNIVLKSGAKVNDSKEINFNDDLKNASKENVNKIDNFNDNDLENAFKENVNEGDNFKEDELDNTPTKNSNKGDIFSDDLVNAFKENVNEGDSFTDITSKDDGNIIDAPLENSCKDNDSERNTLNDDGDCFYETLDDEKRQNTDYGGILTEKDEDALLNSDPNEDNDNLIDEDGFLITDSNRDNVILTDTDKDLI